MKVLVVVAHPDDEVLGAGASIYKLTREGHEVAVATLVNHAAARSNLSSHLSEEQVQARRLLGIEKSYAADFPNIKTNTVPHLDMVKFVESCIVDFEPELIITHSPAETNIDHAIVSDTVRAAVRYPQRNENAAPIKQVWYMECASSTEWCIDSSVRRFTPNLFVEVGQEGLDKKLQALSLYAGVMRPYPHPRSDEALRGLAAWRGAQAGCVYAEAFDCAFRKI
jgi:LmbE family N-acetylglucosaminyl deacetylase